MAWIIHVLSGLTVLSLALSCWQWIVARRFPLHRRGSGGAFAPAVTLLKPLKGCDAETRECLRSWLAQSYSGPVQALFGVAKADDPVCEIVRQLLGEFPALDAELVVCGESLGANAKVSTLIQLERRVKHEVVIVSDADVKVPPDFLGNIVAPLSESAVGLVNCFYALGNPTTLAMRCEAVAINADFWSQVLQSRSLKPLDFALGAAMAIRRESLLVIGGFASLADYLADDYQLGHRVAATGARVELCPVVVECREAPMGWRQVCAHQLRWARTIRICQPLPYFFSILSNASLWPLLLAFAARTPPFFAAACFCLAMRALAAQTLQARLTRSWRHKWYDWLVPIKDLLAAAIWALAFLGNTVHWRNQRYRITSSGKLVPV